MEGYGGIPFLLIQETIMSLTDRIIKGSKLSAVPFTKAPIQNVETADTHIPMLNALLSGKIDGGLVTSGITTLAGPSKHFKSMIGLMLCKAYLDKYEDAVMIFYDCEGGTTPEYVDEIGIPQDRVIYNQIMDIEELKFDMTALLKKSLKPGDKAIIFIDSIGNLASVKEIEDAENEKSVTDMSRAKALKSLYRIITPILKMKLQIPMIQIAHVYDSMDMFSPKKVGGGSGLILASDSVFVIGKKQDKDGKDLVGNDFIIMADKSRFVPEKSKFSLNVKFGEDFIDQYSGLIEQAVEAKLLKKISHPEDGRKKAWRRIGIDDDSHQELSAAGTEEFWKPLLENKEFVKFINSKYSLSSGNVE